MAPAKTHRKSHSCQRRARAPGRPGCSARRPDGNAPDAARARGMAPVIPHKTNEKDKSAFFAKLLYKAAPGSNGASASSKASSASLGGRGDRPQPSIHRQLRRRTMLDPIPPDGLANVDARSESASRTVRSIHRQHLWAERKTPAESCRPRDEPVKQRMFRSSRHPHENIYDRRIDCNPLKLRRESHAATDTQLAATAKYVAGTVYW